MIVFVGFDIENFLYLKGLFKKWKVGEILCFYEYKYKIYGVFRLLMLIRELVVCF